VDLLIDKKELRRQIALRKAELGRAERLVEEASIWAAVEADAKASAASTVLLYSSLPDEVSTKEILAKWSQNKRIILPLVAGDILLLKEYRPGRTHPGYKSIVEPDEDLPDIDPREIELAIIPGVAFDRNRLRLGRGKGFYDRLLPQLDCPIIGVAYRCQIVESLPKDPWDCPVTKVITSEQ